MGKVVLAALAVLLVIAISVGLLVFFVWVLVWNLTDIQNVGFNFWNVFWIVVALAGIFGTGAKATERK